MYHSTKGGIRNLCPLLREGGGRGDEGQTNKEFRRRGATHSMDAKGFQGRGAKDDPWKERGERESWEEKSESAITDNVVGSEPQRLQDVWGAGRAGKGFLGLDKKLQRGSGSVRKTLPFWPGGSLITVGFEGKLEQSYSIGKLWKSFLGELDSHFKQ